MTVLSVRNVGKAFRSYPSEWRRFASWFGLPVKPANEAWVLRNISFDIKPGDSVGIIGENGAGKSTLLKIITGTLQPTEGQVHVNGRIAAILELGMGFNPELTGRQNVSHVAGLMCFSSAQIYEAMEGIEAFAEIGSYFDEPARTYSSGMQVRVAFAVATAWRPEVLIVDEALSVGDTYFQHKSFDRIREFREQGTTLLLVSHDRSAIQSLCDRAVFFEHGSVIKDGNPEEVFDFYNAIIAEKENSTVKVEALSDGRKKTSLGTGEARVVSVSLKDNDGRDVEYIDVGQVVTLCLEVEAYEDIPRLVMGYGIRDRLGQVIYGTNTHLKEMPVANVQAGTRIVYTAKFTMNLGMDSYSLQTALVSSDTHLENNYEWQDLALAFNVVNVNKLHFADCVWLDPEIEINKA